MRNAFNAHSPKISRRDFLKITAIAGLSVGVGTAVGKRILMLDDLHRVTSTHYLMGTIVNFNILTADQALGREAIRLTVAEMERLIMIFDHRQAVAALGRLNQAGSLTDAPVELIDILQQSLQLGALSHGAFDITILPMVEAYRSGQAKIDNLRRFVDYRNVFIEGRDVYFARSGMSITLDGIAKGWIVDAGVAAMRGMGFEDVLVDAGGDMMGLNSDLDENGWRIAIKNPRPSTGSDEYVAAFSVRNKAVTTSGDYLNTYSLDFSRYHIIDPRKGRSPSELASATVIAPTAAQADALSTVLMVMGMRDGLELIQGLPDVEALLVTRNLSICRSSGFPA